MERKIIMISGWNLIILGIYSIGIFITYRLYNNPVILKDKKSMSDFQKCPGQYRVAGALPENYTCPDCGSEVEIWSDEKKVKCPNCGTSIKTPKSWA